MYHINPLSGNHGKYRAQEGDCPFGITEEHHGSVAEARETAEVIYSAV